MCTGKVTVLGKCDKTVGWYMGNGSATVGFIVYIDIVGTTVCVMAEIWRFVVW
jgi:hypothetical protein